MTRALLLLCACAATLCTTLSQFSAQASEKEKLEMANKVYALLKDKCYSCHGEAGKKAMGKVDGDPFSWVLDYDKLVATKLLAPNDEESELYTLMKSGSMPRDPSNTRKRMKLPQEDIDMVLKWIKAGAPKWDPDAKSLPAPTVAWTDLKLKGPDARTGAHMCEGPNNTVVLYGGKTAAGWVRETWVFADGAWSQAAPKTQIMFENTAMGTNSRGMAYDRKRGVVVLFDMLIGPWVWDGKDWKQEKPDNNPAASGHAFAYSETLGAMVLFGGQSFEEDKDVNDTWTYDGKAWTKLTLAQAPEARRNAAMAWSPASKALVLYGGKSGDKEFNDTWLFDGKEWKKQSPATSPLGLGVMASSITSSVLVTSGTDALNTWLWNGKDWQQAKGGPTKRSGFALAFNPKSKGILLFGGKAESHLDDSWELNAAR